MSQFDPKKQELEEILGKLLPYQVQALYLLKDMEEKKNAVIFDPNLFGGKGVLICLMMMAENSLLATRNKNINAFYRELPKNTIVFSKTVDNWRTDLEQYGSHLRVLYHEGDPGPKINFNTTDIVVSSCLNLKQLDDRRSISIKNHDWHRLIVNDDVNDDMTVNKDASDFILNLRAAKRWVIATPEMLNDYSSAKASFMFALLHGRNRVRSFSVPRVQQMFECLRPNIRKLYPFGSTMVETVPIRLTDEEKEIYLTAEYLVKEKLQAIKSSGKFQAIMDEDQQHEEAKLKKERFQNLEHYILRLREMVSSIFVAVTKGDIRGNPELMEKLNKVDGKEICSVCRSELKYVPIVCITKCGHLYCNMCVDDLKKCCCCRKDLDDDKVFCAPINCVSTKTTELLKRVQSKSLIISKFDKFLTWLESPLENMGYKIHRLHRKMEAEEISETVTLFQNSEENVLLLANIESISGELNLSSIHYVFFMEAVKENEENVVINHITGLKGDQNGIFRGAFRLVVTNAIEGKIVGLKGEVEPGFKELNMKEIQEILS